jgi:uncharacterized coiled-coil protein SlyX
MSEIVERIKEFIDKEGITIAMLEKQLGMSNNSFRKSYNNKKAIGTDKLEMFIRKFPNVDANWLLFGETNNDAHLNAHLNAHLDAHLSPKKAKTLCLNCAAKAGQIVQLNKELEICAERVQEHKDRVQELKECVASKNMIIAQQEAEIRRLSSNSGTSFNQSYAS